MPYDVIRDEHKLLSMREFADILKEMADEYVEALAGQNDFTNANHTFGEWSAAFKRFISF